MPSPVVSFRLPPEVLAALKARAAAQQRPLNDLVVEVLRDAVGLQQDAKTTLLDHVRGMATRYWEEQRRPVDVTWLVMSEIEANTGLRGLYQQCISPGGEVDEGARAALHRDIGRSVSRVIGRAAGPRTRSRRKGIAALARTHTLRVDEGEPY
ncbi:MAG: hypothetical protein HY904_12650 [Deltaproteobacteria bacterium]|nr:hypothetical protein [Deltaproteobacteria bacterium]